MISVDGLTKSPKLSRLSLPAISTSHTSVETQSKRSMFKAH